jgi:hypothetical protein
MYVHLGRRQLFPVASKTCLDLKVVSSSPAVLGFLWQKCNQKDGSLNCKCHKCRVSCFGDKIRNQSQGLLRFFIAFKKQCRRCSWWVVGRYISGLTEIVGFCIWLTLIDLTRLTTINRSLWDVNCANFCKFLLEINHSTFPSSSV